MLLLVAKLGHEVEQAELPFLGNPLAPLKNLVYGEIVPSIKAPAAGKEDQLCDRCRHHRLSGLGVRRCLTAEAHGEELRSAFAVSFEEMMCG
jgi:aspartyl-tRNA(Asn)/glutamyl-tRNA(Gln) amidotransferase subunit A